MIKNAIRSVKSIIYDPSYYAHIRTQSVWKGALLLSILGFAGIFLSLILIAPAWFDFASSQLPDRIINSYPDDLVVTVKNGTLSTNQPQPYYIKNNLFLDTSYASKLENLVVFDTNNVLSGDLNTNSTAALVKDKFMIIPGQNNREQIFFFSNMGTSTVIVDKALVTNIVDKIKPYFSPAVLGFGFLFLALGSFFGTVAWVAFHMLYLLLPAFVVFILSLLLRKLSFREAYVVSLYASVPVAVLFYLLSFLPIHQLPYIYSLLVIAIALANTNLKIARI